MGAFALLLAGCAHKRAGGALFCNAAQARFGNKIHTHKATAPAAARLETFLNIHRAFPCGNALAFVVLFILILSSHAWRVEYACFTRGDLPASLPCSPLLCAHPCCLRDSPLLDAYSRNRCCAKQKALQNFLPHFWHRAVHPRPCAL